MRSRVVTSVAVIALAGGVAIASHLIFAALSGRSVALAETGARASGAHAFTFERLGGAGEIDLGDYAGRPVLVVNTASHCGFTYQYDGLQALWTAYRDQGLVVVGAPSDEFNQEYADEAQIAEFCEVNFSIDFPMTALVDVRGRGAHPFFAWAARESQAPSWNFNKYLIDGDGRLVRHYPSAASPEAIARDIDALLGAPG